MFSELALLTAAATVGVLHMSAPDHWATLTMLGRVSKWNLSRLMGVGVMAGVGHVGLSLAVGLALIGADLEFSQQVSSYASEAIGALMLVGGLYYGIRELRRKVEEDYEKETLDKLSRGEGRFGRRFSYFAVLGAVLSPDLAIVPILLLAVSVSLSFTLATALVFGISSIAALLLFIALGVAGLARVFERLPPKYNDALVGFVVAAVGVYVLLGG